MSINPDLTTQPFSLGLDCIFRYDLTGADAITPIVPSRTLRVVDVKWSDSLETADVTDRGAGGFKQSAPTLRTLTLSATLLYDRTNTDFEDLYAAYSNRQRVVVGVGDDRGNYFVFVATISKFDLDQTLTEAVKADVEIIPSRGGFTPCMD